MVSTQKQKRASTPEKPPSSTAVGRMSLLLEDIREQNRAVALEAASSSELGAHTQRIERLGVDVADLRQRVDGLEAAIDQQRPGTK